MRSGNIYYTLIINVIGIIKSSIYEKLKHTEKTESKSRHNIMLVIIGVVITIISLIYMTVYYRTNQIVFIVCWLACVLGSAFVFFNGEALIAFIQSKYYKKYIKNILVLSDVKYYYDKNKKIFCANTWLLFVIFFFITFALISYPNMNYYAMTYSPFNMAYVEIGNHFISISNEEIEAIAKNNNNRLILNDTVNFARNNAFTVFCVDDINTMLNKDYNIDSSSFLFVYGYDVNDGYDHDYNFDISSINVTSTDGKKEFGIQDKIIDPLFGRINAISNYLLLANKDDFEWLMSNSNDFDIKGTLHLYNFENWHISGGIVNEVWERLLEKNNIDRSDYENSRFFRVSSRIEAYDTAIKSSNLLIFVFLYLSLLLYFSSLVMIHFKLKMEHENEKKKFYSLYRIGIQETEIKKMVYQKILVVFFTSPVYAIILNLAFSQCIFNQYRIGIVSILYTAIMSIVFLLIHLFVYRWYANYYNKGITSDMYGCR